MRGPHHSCSGTLGDVTTASPSHWRDEVAGLAARVRATPARGATRLIAIGGRGGAGKSTLAAALAAQDPSLQVVHLDDLHREGGANDPGAIAWDKVHELLNGLRAGRSVSYRRLDWECNWLDDRPIRVPAGGTVIFEGVSAIRGVGGALGDPYDLTVWIDCDPQVAMERGITRDGGGDHIRAFWDAWITREHEYIADQRPHELADVVLYA